MASVPSARRKRLTTAIFKVNFATGTTEGKVLALKGVSKARLNSVVGTIWVEYNPKIVSESKIKALCMNED